MGDTSPPRDVIRVILRRMIYFAPPSCSRPPLAGVNMMKRRARYFILADDRLRGYRRGDSKLYAMTARRYRAKEANDDGFIMTIRPLSRTFAASMATEAAIANRPKLPVDEIADRRTVVAAMANRKSAIKRHVLLFDQREPAKPGRQ